jgi:hypothetical protein
MISDHTLVWEDAMAKRYLAAFVLLTFSVPTWADTYPAHVLIIRHAEKPADGPSLSPEGNARAAALPKLFKKSDSRPDPCPAPDFIFAAMNSKESHRSVETVAPLAEKLGLKVNADIKNEDFEDLVRELVKNPKYEGKTVLICWHHQKMPHLAKALHGVDIPKHIEDDVFNLIWQIDYDKDGKAKTTQGSQKLLPGD